MNCGDEMECSVCCFSGHREIPGEDREPLAFLLYRYVTQLADCGTKEFYCGGALGFDTMAAQAVLKARERDPEIRLYLAIPYRGMERHWSPEKRVPYARILEQADRVVYLSERYDSGCMLRRNRYMVDRSSICLCYMLKNTGGTAYTVAYALKRGLEVVNLALEVDNT